MKNVCVKFNNYNIGKTFKIISRMLYLLVIFSLFTLMLAGCQAKAKQDEDAHIDDINIEDVNIDYYSFTDSLGNNVTLKDKPQRVVSLVGSYAETWLLAGGELIGVTNDVISERNMDLPGNTKIVGTIKEPNLEEIIALSPDFVLLTPDVESHIKVAETLEKMDINFAFFKVEHFEDYLSMLKVCTDITGNDELYEKNGLAVKNQIEDILAKIDQKNNPNILFIRAFSSGAKAKNDDNMACKIFNDLGTVNIASKHESLLEDLSMEKIIEEDPEFIFVVTMGN
ncbi:MAG: ABC transporter substrate-binding protein, partial [Clostridiaceae bacterium]|nr:ABC transporter substrate-binding protein [Clostridiaceae bacterium]